MLKLAFSIHQSSKLTNKHPTWCVINSNIKTFNRIAFHTHFSSRAILSEKDFENIHAEEKTVKQEESTTESVNQITKSSESIPKSSSTNNDDPSLFSEFMKKKQKEDHELEGYNNPFYRDVDEKTAIEYQDAMNDKESTPFPTWMMNFYRTASISVLLIVCYGLVVAKLDEQSINERYSLLEKKKKEREEQMRNLQFELELTTSVKEKKGLFAGLKALTQEEK